MDFFKPSPSSPVMPIGTEIQSMPAISGYDALSMSPTSPKSLHSAPPPSPTPPPQQNMSNLSGIPTGRYNGGQSFPTLKPNMPSPGLTMFPRPQTNMSNLVGLPTGHHSSPYYNQPDSLQLSPKEMDMIIRLRQELPPAPSSYVTPEQTRYETEQEKVKLAEDAMMRDIQAKVDRTKAQNSALQSMVDNIGKMVPKHKPLTSTTDKKTDKETDSSKK